MKIIHKIFKQSDEDDDEDDEGEDEDDEDEDEDDEDDDEDFDDTDDDEDDDEDDIADEYEEFTYYESQVKCSIYLLCTAKKTRLAINKKFSLPGKCGR